MSSKRHGDDKLSTDEREAIADDVADRVAAKTPVVGVKSDESSERIRGLAREEIRPAVTKHKLDCISPGGALCSVSEKVDDLRKAAAKQNGAIAVLAIIVPLAVGYWQNSKSNDRLQKQIDVAAEVARQLKAVQDATKHGGASLKLDEKPETLAQVDVKAYGQE